MCISNGIALSTPIHLLSIHLSHKNVSLWIVNIGRGSVHINRVALDVLIHLLSSFSSDILFKS